MYQYKAILSKTNEVIAEGHTLQEVEHQITHFKRGPKHGEHTSSGDTIKIYHIHREGEKKLLKTI